MNKRHDDGLEWLRTSRRKIAAACGYDLARQAEVYRQAAAKHTYRVYKGETAPATMPRRLKRTA
ncbi:MAG: hypothetical protein ACREUU_09020 [Gammaproteobacteria bacterium]